MRKYWFVTFITIIAPISIVSFQNATPSRLCSAAVLANLRETATAQKKYVKINCHVTLTKSDVITKQIVLEGDAANGVIFDCRGAKISRTGDSIAIRSLRKVNASGVESWSRPKNVTVRNCLIEGAVRVSGMDLNANGIGNEGALKKSSQRDKYHTARAQAAAPTQILLENLTIKGLGRNPLYVAPGVTHLTFRNSSIGGDTGGVGIYLDAESAYNIIQNNKVSPDTETRELIAIDGSAHNRIIGNYFSNLNEGGIYIYRNCGEGGSIRHQMPRHNHIINNIFFYKKYKGEKPSVWVASRNGNSYYCDHDKGYNFGSSIDDSDFARRNIIASNQIYVLPEDTMIRLGDADNSVFDNRTVASATKEKSGCFLISEQAYIKHSQKRVVQAPGSSATCQQISCNDGLTESHPAACPSITSKVVSFSCKQQNKGSCEKTVSCPSSYKIKDVRAVCNLETDYVSDSSVTALAWNSISVHRSSDIVSDGQCEIRGSQISSGTKPLNMSGLSAVSVGCQEKDDEKSPGDCEIRGELRCIK